MRKGRVKYTLGFIGLLLLGSVFTLRAIPKTRWRMTVVRLKMTGSLPNITWKELFQMSMMGEHYNLAALAETPNPYAVIEDPYIAPADIETARNIFQSHCSVCHGNNGAGGTGGPVLQGRQMVNGSSDWALFKTITSGIPGTAMPASGVSWRERWLLVADIKTIMHQGRIRSEVHVIPAINPVDEVDIHYADKFPEQWLTYSGTYDSHRYSTINQITPANVANLRLLWMRQYDTSEPSIEATPLVIGGYMFLTAPANRVEALDVRSGAVIWTYNRELPKDDVSICCGRVNRGLAALGDTIFLGTLDAHLIALDMKTGAVRWDVPIANYHDGYSITGAPLALKNIVITGVAGGEFGIRGFITARDVQTGKELWRFNTIPAPKEKGSETWPGDSWKTGGGPTWITGSFDPQLSLVYWPVGNPSPNFDNDVRKGDNLYTNSVVALDADNGNLRWYFQFTPHDAFDWDATEPLILFDGKIAGKTQPLLAQADRNGFYYVLNRETGALYSARAFGKVTWSDATDRLGRPVISPKAYPTTRGTSLLPGVGGATNWESPSYSPMTDLVYIPVLDWGGIFYKGPDTYVPGHPFNGGSFQYSDYTQAETAIRAVNAETGEKVWEFRNPGTNVGGILSTAGNVVFGSQLDDVFALDSKTGRLLWHVGTSGRIVAGPITYLYKGKQMITIVAGHDLLTFGL